MTSYNCLGSDNSFSPKDKSKELLKEIQGSGKSKRIYLFLLLLEGF